MALIAVTATQPGTPGIRQLSIEVVNTASIIESPTTVGISDNPYMLNSVTDIDKTLDMMQSLGVSDVRVAIPWAGVQPTDASTYSWSKMDKIVNAAASRGMGVLGVLTTTPSWAGTSATGHTDPATFATFASTVADHYGSKVSAYEIWNEPNAAWSYSPVDPTSYTAMLQAGYTAIKTATHGAAEVIGGVVGAGPTQDTSQLDPVSFITQMYAAGAHGYFDALSFHPYDFFNTFSQGPIATPGTSPLDQLTAIRNLMNSNGDAAEKIWLSEYGEPTRVFSEQNQADYLTDLVKTWQTISGAGPIFIYNTRDTAADPNADISNNDFGLFHYDWTPKIAAGVVKALIASLNPAPVPSPAPNPFAAFVAAIQYAFAQVGNVFASLANSFVASAQKFFTAIAAAFGLVGKTNGTPASATAPARVKPVSATRTTPLSTAVVAAAATGTPTVPSKQDRRGGSKRGHAIRADSDSATAAANTSVDVQTQAKVKSHRDVPARGHDHGWQAGAHRDAARAARHQ